MHANTAAWLVAPLVMTGFSAVVAFITRRRAAFVGGSLAAWFFASLPGPQVRLHYHAGTPLEDIIMNSVRETVERSWNLVPMAAVIGVIVGLLYSDWSLRNR